MNEKKFNARFIPKGDIEANWRKALGFIPHDKEIIVYKPDENNEKARLKIGDGVSGVNELPFFAPTSTPDYNQNDPEGEGYIKNRPFYSDYEIKKVIIPEIEPEFYSASDLPEGFKSACEYGTVEAPIGSGNKYIWNTDDVSTEILFKTCYVYANEDKTFYYPYMLYFGNPLIAGFSEETLEYLIIDTSSKEDYFVACLPDGIKDMEIVMVYPENKIPQKVSLTYPDEMETLTIVPEGEYSFIEMEGGE